MHMHCAHLNHEELDRGKWLYSKYMSRHSCRHFGIDTDQMLSQNVKK